MSRSKLIFFVQVLFAFIVLGGTLLFATTQQQTQAGDEPLLTPSYLAFIIHEFTPTPTATNTPTPTNTPVPTAVINTSGDTSVIQGFASTNLSGSTAIYTGYHKSGCFGASDTLKDSRGLLKFNIPNTPTGATITEATLNIHLAAVCFENSGSRSVKAFPITESWSVSDVNWNNQPDRASSSSGSVSIQLRSNQDFDWHSMEITDLVSNWASGSVTNNGLMLRSPENSNSDFAWILFGSEDNSNNITPYLEITYSNGATALVSFNDTTPNLNASPASTCSTTADGISFCALDGLLPFTDE